MARALDGIRIFGKHPVTVDSRNKGGLAGPGRPIERCDALVNNLAPGALDRMGITREHIQNLNPRMVVASGKGFGPGLFRHCKVYENVAQFAGGRAALSGIEGGIPMVTGAQIGDSGLAPGIVAALYRRTHTGRGRKVLQLPGLSADKCEALRAEKAI